MTTVDELHRNLIRVPWLSMVGRSGEMPLQLYHEDVQSWDEAMEMRNIAAQREVFNDARGLLARQLMREHRKEFRNWNEICSDAKERLELQVFPSIQEAINAHAPSHIPKVEKDFLFSTIAWDVVSAWMEVAYSHLVPMRVYGDVLNIYLAGHYPCSWDGQWPEGRIWVF